MSTTGNQTGIILPIFTWILLFIKVNSTTLNSTVEFRDVFQQQNCPALPGNNRFLGFQIPAVNTNQQQFNVMSIIYDTQLRSPVSSTVLYNQENTAGGIRPNSNAWRTWNCAGYPEPNCDLDQFPTGYDRGHLTPSCHWRFTQTVALSTFYCINQAPQASAFNRYIWYNQVEVPISNIARVRGGLVMTGLTEAAFGNPPDFNRHYPGFFWKMLCYINAQGMPEIVGYYAVNANNTAVVRATQADILNIMGPVYRTTVQAAWIQANNNLRGNRIINTPIPSGQDCAAAAMRDAEIVAELERYDYKQCEPNCCDGDEALIQGKGQ